MPEDWQVAQYPHPSDEHLGVAKSAGASDGHHPIRGDARGKGEDTNIVPIPSFNLYQNHGFKMCNPQPCPILLRDSVSGGLVKPRKLHFISVASE